MRNSWLRWNCVKQPNGQVHFWRLPLAMFGRVRFYLHHFVNEDDARHPHNHPWNCLSIGLWGSYVDQPVDAPSKLYRAPFVRYFPSTHAHMVKHVRNAWTLCVVWTPKNGKREWGHYLNDGIFVPSEDYYERGLWKPAQEQEQ